MHEMEDALFSRALDHEASAEDWQQLDEIARDDPQVWERLADALRAEGCMRRAVSDTLDQVDSPESGGVSGQSGGEPGQPGGEPGDVPGVVVGRPGHGRWLMPLTCATFGAVGAALGLLWALAGEPAETEVPAPTVSERTVSEPGALAPEPPVETLLTSKDRRQPEATSAEVGDLVRELPLVVLESRPGQTGIDLLILERTLRRVHVEEFFEVHRDDQGVPAVLSVEEPPRLPRSSL